MSSPTLQSLSRKVATLEKQLAKIAEWQEDETLRIYTNLAMFSAHSVPPEMLSLAFNSLLRRMWRASNKPLQAALHALETTELARLFAETGEEITESAKKNHK